MFVNQWFLNASMGRIFCGTIRKLKRRPAVFADAHLHGSFRLTPLPAFLPHSRRQASSPHLLGVGYGYASFFRLSGVTNLATHQCVYLFVQHQALEVQIVQVG
jgi:hypothetical protein